MSDLAQAIVDLGKAAEDRRHARQNLAESTQVVADAIVKQLRAGDQIAVHAGGSGAVATYSVWPVSWRLGTNEFSNPTPTLCRNGAIVGSPAKGSEGYRSAHAEGSSVRIVSSEELAAFALEVPQVIAGFTELVGKQARQFDLGARIVAQLKVKGPDVPTTGKFRNGPRIPWSLYTAEVTFERSVDSAQVSRVAQFFNMPVMETTGGKQVRFNVVHKDMQAARQVAENQVTEILSSKSGWQIEVHGPTNG